MPKQKVFVHHDDRLTVPVSIVTYLHCGLCIREMPKGESPQSWSRTQVGITQDGRLQIVCNRHNVNVDLISWEVGEEC